MGDEPLIHSLGGGSLYGGLLASFYALPAHAFGVMTRRSPVDWKSTI